MGDADSETFLVEQEEIDQKIFHFMEHEREIEDVMRQLNILGEKNKTDEKNSMIITLTSASDGSI